jgi:hypothetical protein
MSAVCWISDVNYFGTFWFVGLFMHIGGSWIHTLLAPLLVFGYDVSKEFDQRNLNPKFNA